MKEEDIRDDLHHQALIRTGGESIQGTCREQTSITLRERDPDAGSDNEDAKQNAGQAAAQDVGERHNEEVHVAERDDSHAGEHAKLLLIQLELFTQ